MGRVWSSMLIGAILNLPDMSARCRRFSCTRLPPTQPTPTIFDILCFPSAASVQCIHPNRDTPCTDILTNNSGSMLSSWETCLHCDPSADLDFLESKIQRRISLYLGTASTKSMEEGTDSQVNLFAVLCASSFTFSKTANYKGEGATFKKSLVIMWPGSPSPSPSLTSFTSESDSIPLFHFLLYIIG